VLTIEELALCFMLLSCLSFSFALKIEASRFFETSLGFLPNVGIYIPEEGTTAVRISNPAF
jgi:hypothetical protein